MFATASTPLQNSCNLSHQVAELPSRRDAEMGPKFLTGAGGVVLFLGREMLRELQAGVLSESGFFNAALVNI